jgi:putative Mn2+ efflux pump MntP
MKVTRKMLLIITASLGVLIIVYSLVRHFLGIGLSEKMEKWMMDGIVIAALGCFMYNRKLAKDERLAKEAAQKAEEEKERRRLEGAEDEEPDEPEDYSENDDNIPHWERNKIKKEE